MIETRSLEGLRKFDWIVPTIIGIACGFTFARSVWWELCKLGPDGPIWLFENAVLLLILPIVVLWLRRVRGMGFSISIVVSLCIAILALPFGYSVVRVLGAIVG